MLDSIRNQFIDMSLVATAKAHWALFKLKKLEPASFGLLSNGVRVLTQQIPNGQKTTVGLMVGAGSLNERDGVHKRGAAHFLEHMVANQIIDELVPNIGDSVRRSAISMTAGTWGDKTVYCAVVDPAYASETISAIASAVSAPQLREDQIEIERNRARAELRNKQFYSVPYNRINEVLFADFPEVGNAIGNEESLSSLSGMDLRRFWNEKYKGGDTVVLVSSPLTHSAVVEQLERELALPVGRSDPMSYPKYPIGELKTLDAKTAGCASLELIFENPDPTKVAVFDVIGQMLMADDSLLRHRLNREGLAYGASCSYYSKLNQLSVSITAAKINGSVETVSNEMKALIGPVDPVDLEKAKEASLRKLSNRMSSPLDCVAATASYIAEGNETLYQADFEAQIRAVTAEDIHVAMHDLLQQTPTLLVIGDPKEAPTIDDVRDIFALEPSRSVVAVPRRAPSFRPVI